MELLEEVKELEDEAGMKVPSGLMFCMSKQGILKGTRHKSNIKHTIFLIRAGMDIIETSNLDCSGEYFKDGVFHDKI